MIEVPYMTPPLPAEKNASGRLIATGVILLVIAVFCGCFSAMMPVGYFISKAQYVKSQAALSHGPTVMQRGGQTVHLYQPPPPQPVSQIVTGAAIYLAIAVAGVWLGIAALKKHRYVRPLVMVLATQGLIIGVLTMVMMLAMTPVIIDQLNRTSAMPTSVSIIGIVIGIAVMCVFAIAPPIALLLLVRPDSVRVTAELFDLKPRWTDGLPIKLLGLVLTIALFAASELFLLIRPALPMVTFFLTGLPAIVLVLIHMAVLAWATVRIYRRDDRGWRAAFWVITAPLLLFFVSTVTMPMEKYAAILNDQPDAMQLMLDHEPLFRLMWMCISAAFLASFVIYMLQVRPLVRPVADTPTD